MPLISREKKNSSEVSADEFELITEEELRKVDGLQ